MLQKLIQRLVLGVSLAISSNCGTETGAGEKPSEREVRKKYAVLLVDATYSNETKFDPITFPRGIQNMEEELANMSEVLRVANARGIPVMEISMQVCTILGGARTCDQTNPYLTQFRSSNWTPLVKRYADSFQEKDLDRQLRARGVTDLIVMGYHQNHCVMGTVKTALERGYQVHTSFDTMQGTGSNRCEILVHGVSQGRYDPCTTHKPGLQEEVRYLELEVEVARAFYASQTSLAENFTDFPLFGL